MPAIVTYWRMIYEMSNMGKALFDYNNNQNNEYPVPANAQWDPAIPLLEACNHTHRYEKSTGQCTTTFSDDLVTE